MSTVIHPLTREGTVPVATTQAALVALTKLGDVVSTVTVLTLVPAATETSALTALAITELGLWTGVIMVGVLSLAGVIAVAEVAKLTFDALSQWIGSGFPVGWVARTVVYLSTGAWFGYLAVKNTNELLRVVLGT